MDGGKERKVELRRGRLEVRKGRTDVRKGRMKVKKGRMELGGDTHEKYYNIAQILMERLNKQAYQRSYEQVGLLSNHQLEAFLSSSSCFFPYM